MTRLRKTALVALVLIIGATVFIFVRRSSSPTGENSEVGISAEMPYETQFIEVNGSQIAYVAAGEGDPILFIHGNPTSKYLWRNIMPHLEDQGYVIALDLIGMGESDKPEIGYSFDEHSQYLDGFIEEMGLENITLVIHDWGSGLGFDYAARNPDNVKAIAFMEAAITPAFPPDTSVVFRTLRSDGIGARLVLGQNIFIETILPTGIARELTETEMEVYRAPFPDEKSRKPIFEWFRQIPADGESPEVSARVAAYNAWFVDSELPKLHLYADPGALILLEHVEELKAMNLTNYEAVYIGEGLHFVQEDQPTAIGENISEWYGRITQ